MVVDNIVEKEPSSAFKDKHNLFWGIHCHTCCNWQELEPGAFRFREEYKDDGMSVDWSKYCSTPELCAKYRENPQKYAVAQISVRALKEIGKKISPNVELEHDPIYNPKLKEINRAHSLIKNFYPKKNLVKIRAELVQHKECFISHPLNRPPEVCNNCPRKDIG